MMVQSRQPLPVVCSPKISPEFFDFIISDECHHSIYNLWRRVLEYFDAYLVGLMATPDDRTYGFCGLRIRTQGARYPMRIRDTGSALGKTEPDSGS